MDLSVIPFGSEIALGLLAILAAVLGLIAKLVSRTPDNQSTSSDPMRAADMERLMVKIAETEVNLRNLFDERMEVGETQTRHAIALLGRQTAERLDQIDRQSAQRIQSLGDNIARTIREVDVEDRRQFERILDKLDRRGGDY